MLVLELDFDGTAFDELCDAIGDNVIYQVHMYEPFAFTHQEIHKGFGPTTYPDEAKARLRRGFRGPPHGL